MLAQTIPGAVAITNVAVQGGTISKFFHGVFVGTPNAAGTPTKVKLDNITAVNNSKTISTSPELSSPAQWPLRVRFSACWIRSCNPWGIRQSGQ